MTAQAQARAWLAALPDLPAVDVTGTFDAFMARHTEALPAQAKAKAARARRDSDRRYRDSRRTVSARAVPKNTGGDKNARDYRDSSA